MAAAGLAMAGPLGAAAPAQVETDRQNSGAVLVDPKPLFELSPYLYMQFMEPLGATDGSVEAAWDHLRDQVCSFQGRRVYRGMGYAERSRLGSGGSIRTWTVSDPPSWGTDADIAGVGPIPSSIGCVESFQCRSQTVVFRPLR